MKPIDYRNETFDMVRQRGLTRERFKVYEAFQKFGPGTTRAIAKAAGMDVVNLRPRATELYQLGFLKLIDGDSKGHEGIYRAFTIEEARAKFFVDQNTANKRTYQEELAL